VPRRRDELAWSSRPRLVPTRDIVAESDSNRGHRLYELYLTSGDANLQLDRARPAVNVHRSVPFVTIKILRSTKRFSWSLGGDNYKKNAGIPERHRDAAFEFVPDFQRAVLPALRVFQQIVKCAFAMYRHRTRFAPVRVGSCAAIRVYPLAQSARIVRARIR